MRRIRLVLARGALGPLRFARALGFACAATLRFATAHFSAIFRFASGASPLRLHRHLPAVRLVSRHFPPLHVALCRFNSSAAPISRFVFAVRCVILAPMHAIWYRAEYRPSPSGAPWRSLPHPVKSESLNLLSLFVSLCRASSRVIPGFFLRRYRALLPHFARICAI